MPDTSPAMTENSNAGVPYLSFPLFDMTGLVTDAFSTRHGGVSTGIFSSLNFATIRGDWPEAVYENYRRMGRALSCPPENMVLAMQTHTTNVVRVTRDDAGRGLFKPRLRGGVDGLVTDVPQLMLVTFYADCVPLYFLDPIKKAIGLSHSGRVGTQNNMPSVTVSKMTTEFGSRPEDILVGIGPCICGDCYEVDDAAAQRFMQPPFSEYEGVLQKGRPGHWQLDLGRACRRLLLDAGILEQHIATAGICTCCNPDKFFSHRASHGMRGNLCAFLMLK